MQGKQSSWKLPTLEERNKKAFLSTAGFSKLFLFRDRENNLQNFTLTKGAADLRLLKRVISPDVGWNVGSQLQI